MYRKWLMLLLLSVTTLIAGCGGKQKPPDPATVTSPAPSPAEIKWTYQLDAVGLELRVDKNLNAYDGQPHALLLGVYQLTNLNRFNELATTPSGLRTLLECKSFDQSVTHVQRVFVQPGQNAAISMNRAEGSRFMAVAAGYYDLQGRATRTWPIPMDSERSGMLFWSDTTYAPAKLKAILILGPHEIQKVGN